MAEIPWFAWIAIVAILMWGVVMVFGKSSNMSKNAAGDDDEQTREIEHLRRRVEDLEARLNRPDS